MLQPHLTTSLKSFIFQNQHTSQSTTIQIPIPHSLPSVDIRYIIDSFREKHSLYLPLEWKVYDPQIFTFKRIDIEKPLNEIYFLSPVVLLKYKELGVDSDCDSLNSKADSETRKERNKERTIKEVVECVKKWREIHNTLDKYRNKVNLYDAAKVVGIAKKSLDDYFCQLRLAQEYGFDFQRNMGEKIGVLRSFVRKNRPKGETSTKERLPKKLRVIEDFVLGSGSTSYIKKEEETQKVKEMEQQFPQTVGMIQEQYQPPLEIIPQDELEHRFFNCFNFMIDDPNDPFISYGYMRSNSNKVSEIESSDFLFF